MHVKIVQYSYIYVYITVHPHAQKQKVHFDRKWITIKYTTNDVYWTKEHYGTFTMHHVQSKTDEGMLHH